MIPLKMMILIMMMSIQSVRSGISWKDYVPGVEETLDNSELRFAEEDGTARLGFVQLNSGSTSFNTTLNLTGPILLGMGIAAATLFYAYFNAFQGGSGGYNRYKRSVENYPLAEATTDMVDMLDVISLIHTMEDSFTLIGLKSPVCKLRAVCEIHQPNHPMPEVDTVAEVVKMVVIRLKKGEGERVEELVSNWLKAAEEGRR